MQEILRFENLSFSYDGGKTVLDSVSLSIGGGEKIALLGPNGSGKSTLFLCANRVLKPDGEIYLRGNPVDNKKRNVKKLREAVGIVFQNPDDQIIASNVYEEISFGPMNMDISIEDVRKRIDSAIEYLNLENFIDRHTQYLSGGEKKMVTIADILAMSPDIMLFDEPFSSLDYINAKQLENVLDMLPEKGIAVVVSTHDMDFAWKWADRIIFLNEGRIVYDGGRREFFTNTDFAEKYNIDRPSIVRFCEKMGIDDIPRTIDGMKIQVHKGENNDKRF